MFIFCSGSGKAIKQLKKSKMYLYPKWIRVWHVINAVLFIILIITGISMQYTDKENAAIVVGFAMAVKWHNFAAVVLTVNYIVFVAGNLRVPKTENITG